MLENGLTLAYLAASILFILSLGGLSTQETARRGNIYGIIGMVIAVVATFFHDQITSYYLAPLAIGAGAVLGLFLSARVAMTAMPELVAMLHSFVGLAAVLVGISTFLNPGEGGGVAEKIVHDVEIWLDIAIGAITFTGSVIAWAKLSGRMSGKPLLLPGRHLLNVVAAVTAIGLVVPFVALGLGEGDGETMRLVCVLVMTGITSLLGVHLVAAIGGADMPVVVSLLNSYSGWTAAAAGFMLSNDLLIVTGALVGSSGAILSYIMCKAMNRSIWNVVFGGFGTDDAAPAAPPPDATAVEVREIVADDLAARLADARDVVIVPGYGMAVAQAQHPVRALTDKLTARGVRVRYAIHPVAGRLPGHMNVLLAEAGLPYDIVLEMDEINDDLPDTDIVLVIGANDIVNPGAEINPASPIFGMPVLQVWNSDLVVVFKRSLRVGYAGVGNPLFFRENTQMLFGDAKVSVNALNAALD